MRYFLEAAYKGTRYSGFQAQLNARTIQGEIEAAFGTLFPALRNTAIENKSELKMTGSSRTDAGVHAYQNFFHFDIDFEFQQKWLYNLNAILSDDIVIKNILPVSNHAHCRFDALSRTYYYHICQFKNPFLLDRAYYYPYTLDIEKLNIAASIIKQNTDFTSFSKRNTQVKNFNCQIIESRWLQQNGMLIYEVKANRFLRGMVRALTATMLKIGRDRISINDFNAIIHSKNCTQAYFDAPAHGLTLVEVSYK